MGDILKFRTNIPESPLQLAFDEGVPCESQFGDQVRFKLVDERVMFCSPFVARKIADLGIRRNVPFSMCKKEVKKGNRNSFEWEILRLDGQGSPTPTVAAVAAVTAPVLAAKATKAQVNPVTQQTQVSTPQVIAPGKYTELFKRAMRTAIDVARDGENYAAEGGWKLQLDGRCVTTMAITISIDFLKQQQGRAS